MNNTSQNHTDSFFRQGLSSPPEFVPSENNWKAMERMLQPEPSRRIAMWIYLASGIAASLLMFLWLMPQNDVTEIQQPVASQAKVPLAIPDVLPDIPTLKNYPKGVSPSAFNRSSIDHMSRVLISQADKPPGTETSSYPVPTKNLLNHAAYAAIHPSLSGNPSMPDKLAGESLVPSDLKQKSPSLQENNRQVTEAAKTSKWILGLAVSPDVNSVKGLNRGSFGISAGAGLSYNITERLSAGTGVYYSQKTYSSDKDSYRATEKPFATWASFSTRIDADCRVIDIPLNLTFKLSNVKQSKFYATAGLSSYIMLSEKYDFVYSPSPAYPSPGREYTVRNENKHVLSVVNLGLAVERPISERTSLVIEPYAKLPLSGIGQGQTDLKSFGLGFKLNYSLKKKAEFFKSNRTENK